MSKKRVTSGLRTDFRMFCFLNRPEETLLLFIGKNYDKAKIINRLEQCLA